MESKRDEWSLRRPVNAIVLGMLWIAGAGATLVAGVLWKSLAIAVVSGLLAGAIYSREKYWRRFVALAALLFGMSTASVVSGHNNGVWTDVLIDARFMAVALTLAWLVGAVRRAAGKSADTAAVAERS